MVVCSPVTLSLRLLVRVTWFKQCLIFSLFERFNSTVKRQRYHYHVSENTQAITRQT